MQGSRVRRVLKERLEIQEPQVRQVFKASPV